MRRLQLLESFCQTIFGQEPNPRQNRNGVLMDAQEVPSVERLSEFAATPRRVSAQETQVASPSWEGLVVVRAPLKGLAWRAETEAALRRASCTPVKRN